MRIKPLPKLDLAIARRLAEFRQNSGRSREELANRAGIDPDLLARVELGRMPLRYGDAEKLLPALVGGEMGITPINPLWLAFGKKPVQLQWPFLLPRAKEIGLNPKTRFSEFVTANRDILFALAQDPPKAALPEGWLFSYTLRQAVLRAQKARFDAALAIYDNVLRFSAERRPKKCQR